MGNEEVVGGFDDYLEVFRKPIRDGRLGVPVIWRSMIVTLHRSSEFEICKNGPIRLCLTLELHSYDRFVKIKFVVEVVVGDGVRGGLVVRHLYCRIHHNSERP